MNIPDLFIHARLAVAVERVVMLGDSRHNLRNEIDPLPRFLGEGQ